MSIKNTVLSLFKGTRRLEWIAACAILAVICLIWAAAGTTSTGTALETRVERTLSQIDGAGRVRVVIGEDAGVLVVADGADDLRVSLALTRAVRALLNVDALRIEVMKMR